MFHIHTPLWLCLVAMVAVEIPLSSIKNIRKLVHTNILATCLIAFGLASCLYLAIFSSIEAIPEEENAEADEGIGRAIQEADVGGPGPRMGAWNDHWYLFIGTSVSTGSKKVKSAYFNWVAHLFFPRLLGALVRRFNYPLHSSPGSFASTRFNKAISHCLRPYHFFHCIILCVLWTNMLESLS